MHSVAKNHEKHAHKQSDAPLPSNYCAGSDPAALLTQDVSISETPVHRDPQGETVEPWGARKDNSKQKVGLVCYSNLNQQQSITYYISNTQNTGVQSIIF